MKCPTCRSDEVKRVRGLKVFREFRCEGCGTVWTPKGDALATLVVGLFCLLFFLSALFAGRPGALIAPESLAAAGVGIGLTSSAIAVLVRKPRRPDSR